MISFLASFKYHFLGESNLNTYPGDVVNQLWVQLLRMETWGRNKHLISIFCVHNTVLIIILDI